jgi:Rap1a immunity proteins
MRIYRLATLLMAVVLALAPISVNAKIGEFTGNDYFRECTTTNADQRPKNADEQDMAVFCVGYTVGAVTTILAMNGRLFCIPPNTTTPQDILKATVAFMQTHPDQKQYLLASVMLGAVAAQWPCKSK